jgi:hypothetical protein
VIFEPNQKKNRKGEKNEKEKKKRQLSVKHKPRIAYGAVILDLSSATVFPVINVTSVIANTCTQKNKIKKKYTKTNHKFYTSPTILPTTPNVTTRGRSLACNLDI